MLLTYAIPLPAKTKETFDWIEKNKEWLVKQGIQLDMVEVGKDHRYDDAIRARWTGDRDLIVLEWDEVPSRAMIRRLLKCPEELCPVEYPLTGCRVVVRNGTYSCEDHGLHNSCRLVGPSGDPSDWKWVEKGTTHCSYWGLGLTRFRKELMARILPQWVFKHHADIDSVMSVYLHQKGIEGHIHWESLKHNGARVEYHPPELTLFNRDETQVVAKLRFAGVNVLGIAKTARSKT